MLEWRRGEETGEAWRLWEREGGKVRPGGVYGNSEKDASLVEMLLPSILDLSLRVVDVPLLIGSGGDSDGPEAISLSATTDESDLF